MAYTCDAILVAITSFVSYEEVDGVTILIGKKSLTSKTRLSEFGFANYLGKCFILDGSHVGCHLVHPYHITIRKITPRQKSTVLLRWARAWSFSLAYYKT